MDSVDTYWSDRAALEWQVELGVTDAIGDVPINRYKVPEKIAATVKTVAAPAVPVQQKPIGAVEQARAMAEAAQDLSALKQAVAAFDQCELKRGARQMVFAQGSPTSDIMVIVEAPGRDEDRLGLPLAGDNATLFGRMFSAIGADADPETGIYVAAPMPWRPTNLPPKPADMAMLLPFLQRHIALAQPKLLVLMGSTACQMLLAKSGVSRLRGNWSEAVGIPAMPMAHPTSLIQTPAGKKDAWADLLAIKSKLESLK